MASSQPDERKEQPSTYVVQDRSNRDELDRLRIQDQMINAGMGGVLPEQSDPTAFEHILDVACGTGGWLIETARTYPTLSRLSGIDVSARMLKYAREQAEAQQVSDRVEFRVMDALHKLDFPDNSFDLVNQRLGQSYLRTWEWPRLLSELWRAARPRGVIRLVEGNIAESNSLAMNQLNALFFQSLHRAGHYFTSEVDGVTSELPRLLHQYGGVRDVQTCSYMLTYRADTVAGEDFSVNVQHGFRTMLPFLQKWTRVPDDYEKIYRQALSEMRQPDFVATWNLLVVWGSVS